MATQLILKIDSATMTEIARWTGVAGSVSKIAYDWGGPDILAALNTPDVVRIDPVTMLETNRWTGAPGEIPQKLYSDTFA